MFENHKKDLKKKAKIGATVGVVAGVYVLHRKKMNALIEAWQGVRDETMWASFDEGVQYGLSLAKSLGSGESITKEAAREYAFGAFDKAS